MTELQDAKQRNEVVTSRANSAETELRVLKENIRMTGYREIIIRMVELVIVVLLTYAIDFLKSGDVKNFWVFIVISVVLVILIFMIQWAPRPREKT
jgi:uncharacterized protein YacL